MSPGKAKVEYWHDVRESWPDIPFTAVTACLEGRPITDEHFLSTAAYRGVPFARVGIKVHVDVTGFGVITGNNYSANFNVLFKSGKYAGQTLNCHPKWRITYYDAGGVVLKEFSE
jgi:hypothetical protein